MKPKNFPGRKNQRRITALARFNPNIPKKTQTKQEAEIEYMRLEKRILKPDAARAIRTKKDRSGRSPVTR